MGRKAASIMRRAFAFAGSLQRRLPSWLTQALCAALAVGIGGFTFIYTAAPPYSTSDALSYQAQARSVVESGRFMPQPVPYRELSGESLARFEERPSHGYPNRGFQLCLALVSWLRGDYGQINAHIINLVFVLATAVALYGIGFLTGRSRVAALLLVLAVFSSRAVLASAYNETTEQGMLFFLAASFWAALAGKHLACGIALGLGCVYREQLVMFIPFVAWLALPADGREWRRSLGLMAAGLSVGLVLYVGMDFALASGIQSPYVSGLRLGDKFRAGNVRVLSAYAAAFVEAFYPVLTAIMVVMLCRFPALPRSARILAIAGAATYLLSAAVLYPFPAFRLRFAVGCVAAVWIAFFIAAARYRLGTWIFLFLLIANLAANPPVPARKWRDWFRDPAARWEYLTQRQARMDAVFHPLPAGSVVLTSGPHTAFRFMKKPISVARPGYAEFLDGPNNRMIDVILYVDYGDSGWPVLQEDGTNAIIIDHSNMRFKRIPDLPFRQAAGIMGRVNCFVRID